MQGTGERRAGSGPRDPRFVRASDGPRTHDLRPRRANPYVRGADPADDVAAARAAVARAGTGYARRRPPRRTLGDRVHDFVVRWGWRAYAIPVLAVVTVVALMTSTSSGSPPSKTVADARHGATGTSSRSRAPVLAPAHITLSSDAPGADAVTKIPKGYSLPAGGPYTKTGKGTFRVLKGTSPVIGTRGTLFRYSIDVENGMQHVDLARFQKTVMSVLADKRSWSGHGVRLERVDSGHIDFHVTMTSAMTVRKLCGYTIPVETSCYAPASGGTTPVNRVVFDDARWVRGATAYLGDLAKYREYMINHEDGHALGHEHAHQCLPGGLAPAMMQQTFGLRSSTTHQLCQANPWPYPTGVKIGPHGAPGAEQQDTNTNNEYYIGD